MSEKTSHSHLYQLKPFITVMDDQRVYTEDEIMAAKIKHCIWINEHKKSLFKTQSSGMQKFGPGFMVYKEKDTNSDEREMSWALIEPMEDNEVTYTLKNKVKSLDPYQETVIMFRDLNDIVMAYHIRY